MKKKSKDLLTFICVSVLGFSGFYLIYFLGEKQNNDKSESIELNKGIDTAIVIKTGYLKGNYVIAEFEHNHKNYQIKDHPPSGNNLTGISFIVNFDLTNPSIALIDFTQPFFQENVAIESTQAVVSDILDRNILKFSYIVKGEKYYQFQKYKTSLTVHEGDKFTAIYKISNPEVSFIKL